MRSGEQKGPKDKDLTITLWIRNISFPKILQKNQFCIYFSHYLGLKKMFDPAHQYCSREARFNFLHY